ncbi:MAG: LPS assembly lipoprotein LptE [Halocynthiibacter sp.]
MLLSKIKFGVVGLVLTLIAACGFSPVYGPDETAKTFLNKVSIAAPTDKKSYDLVRQLETRLGRTDEAPYVLRYNLTTSEDSLAITSTQDVTRYHVLGTVTFTVVDRETGAVQYSGSVKNFTGYATTGTVVSTRSSQEDAYKRLMVILADQMTTRLMTAMRNGNT